MVEDPSAVNHLVTSLSEEANFRTGVVSMQFSFAVMGARQPSIF